MAKELIDIIEYTGPGYMPLVDFSQWRVAILNFDEKYLIKNINYFQKHDETDEVFVLLAGNCTLLAADENEILNITAIKMEPLKVYNIEKGILHSHILSEDAKILVIENIDTTVQNSPVVMLSAISKRILFETLSV